MTKLKKTRDFLKSLRFRLIVLFILLGTLPGVLLRAGMLGTYENRAVLIRTSEILSQAKILANQIVSNDYLNQNASVPMINVQLEQLSTIYDGRVMIIDDSFRIVKDTYGLDTGKTVISEEVMRSFYGEEITKHDSENRYIELSVPLVQSESGRCKDPRRDARKRLHGQYQPQFGLSGARYHDHQYGQRGHCRFLRRAVRSRAGEAAP